MGLFKGQYTIDGVKFEMHSKYEQIDEGKNFFLMIWIMMVI